MNGYGSTTSGYGNIMNGCGKPWATIQEKKIKMDKADVLGALIHYSALMLPSAMVVLSLWTIVTNGLYSYIYLPGWSRAIIHSVSLLSLLLSFLVTYLLLGHIHPLARSIMAGSFSVLSIHLYDFWWSTIKWVLLGYGFRIFPLIFVGAVGVLLERLDNKHGIFLFVRNRIYLFCGVLLIISIVFGGMAMSGFYEDMSLYDQHLGPDPNIGNIWWLLSKITVFWLPVPLIQKLDYKVPLRLDPRVLVW